MYIYYSPDYYGEGVSTVYVDLEGSFRLARRRRLFGHVGVLTPFGGIARPDGPRERYDLRAGVAAEFKGGELQLVWTTARRVEDYLAGHKQTHPAIVLAATWSF